MEEIMKQVKEAYRAIVEDKTPMYYSQPIPCTLDGKILRLIYLFKDSPEPLLQGFFTHNNEEFSWRLLSFAERMASLAVRENSRERVSDGLLALLIGYYRVDPRDVITVLAVLYDAATKVGVLPEELFLEVSAVANNNVSQAMSDFTRRTLLNKNLTAFSYKEDSDSDGFRYKRILN